MKASSHVNEVVNDNQETHAKDSLSRVIKRWTVALMIV
jgi:hypothetical protein